MLVIKYIFPANFHNDHCDEGFLQVNRGHFQERFWRNVYGWHSCATCVVVHWLHHSSCKYPRGA